LFDETKAFTKKKKGGQLSETHPEYPHEYLR